MKNKFRRIFLFLLLSGLTWAGDTDAEIIKDLDFFMNMDVLHEDAVLNEAPESDSPNKEIKKEGSL